MYPILVCTNTCVVFSKSVTSQVGCSSESNPYIVLVISFFFFYNNLAGTSPVSFERLLSILLGEE